MEAKRGRNWRSKYLTKEDFWAWVNNDFCHLKKEVKLNRKLLLGILFAVIAVPTIFMIAVVQILG